MAMLVDGRWDENADQSTIRDGKYVRSDSKFRNWITADGSSGFKAEAGRYHLYVAHWCPWAYRTSIFRKLKGLDGTIGISIASSAQKVQGWKYVEGEEGCTPDTVNGKTYLHEIYSLADPHFNGRPTVPTLWDKVRKTIVSNESADIIRMFNSEFRGVVPETVDYYPEDLRAEIDAVNAQIYGSVNDGVYRTGFAKTQAAYEDSIEALFTTLDTMDARLATQRYLCGDRITEADWRFFATLIRFDLVYHMLFKCARKRICDYPNLWNYTLELYQHPGIAEVTRLDHIKTGYYTCLPAINPTRIIPVTPDAIDYTMRHDRGRLPKASL